MRDNSFLQLYSNIIPVRGFNRSVLLDFQFERLFFVPNEIYDLLTIDYCDVEVFKKKYKGSLNAGIEKWVDYLIEKNIIHFTGHPEFFPKLDLEFHFSSKISNMIIELSTINFKVLNHKEKILMMEKIGCKALVLNFFDLPANKVINYLDLFSKSSIDHIELYLNFKFLDIEEHDLIEKFCENLRIKSTTFYACEEKKTGYEYKDRMQLSFLLTDKINLNCGVTSIQNSYVNLKLFTESLNHNTCLNRKISIDKDGNIKNCPSMAQSFGNIKDTTLEEALNHPDFKKYWNITKDQIEVCKDCEFRHICTDCRAYIEDPDNQYSKPLKCGYNPYTNVWEEWSTNPLKQKAIEYYGMQELIKKDA